MENSDINVANGKNIKNNTSYIYGEIENSEYDRLISKVSKKLGISHQAAHELALNKTIKSTADLKKELSHINVKKTEKNKIDSVNSSSNDLKEIFEELNSLKFLQKEILKKDAKMKIVDLKIELPETIENITDYKINSNSYAISDKLFSSEFLQKAENGDTLGYNLAGVMIGTIDTIYSVGTYSKDLIVGIAKTPVDLYKLATKKAESDSFKNV